MIWMVAVFVFWRKVVSDCRRVLCGALRGFVVGFDRLLD